MTDYNTKILTLLEENKLILLQKDDFTINPNFKAFFDSTLKIYPPAKALFKSITMYCPDANETEIIILSQAFHHVLSHTNQYKYVAFLISQRIKKGRT